MYIPDCYQPYQQEDEDYSWKDLYSKSFHYVYLASAQNFDCLRMLHFENNAYKRNFLIMNLVYFIMQFTTK